MSIFGPYGPLPIPTPLSLPEMPEMPEMPEVPEVTEETLRTLIPMPVVQLPLDPAVLARAIQSSAQSGQFDAPIYRFSGLIPAGATVIVPLYAREGFVGVMLSPMRIYASAHHPAIVLNLYVDNVIRATPDGIPMTADLEVSLQQFWLVHYTVRIEIVNGAPWDVIMTLDSQAGVVEKTLFMSKYLPLLTWSWERIMALGEMVAKFAGR